MTVTMPLWLVLLSYVVSTAAGFASCYFGVEKIGTAVMRMRRPNSLEADVTNRRTPWVPIIILIASAMVITIGAMTYLDRRARDHQDAERLADQQSYDRCITEWGDELVRGVNSAKDARREYDNATAARDDSTATVLRVGLQLILDAPSVTGDDLQAALEGARRADREVRRAKATLDATPDKYETPTLACATERTH